MKIYKIIADSRPEYCLICPIFKGCNKGVNTTKDLGNGWKTGGLTPGPDCPIEIINTPR